MDFLVRVDIARAYELPDDERAALIERERSRGREPLSQGVIRQLWRLPGTRTNIGIWSATDADALEEGACQLADPAVRRDFLSQRVGLGRALEMTLTDRTVAAA